MNKIKFEKENKIFVDEVATLTAEELSARLSNLAVDVYHIEQSKELDEKLRETRALAKELGAPYRDAKKVVLDKSAWIAEKLSGAANE